MSIYEYDEEKHMRQEREEWYAIGKEDGIQYGTEKAKGQMIKNLLQTTDMTKEQIAVVAEVELDEVERIAQL